MSANSGIITDAKKYEKGWTGGLPETPCGAGSRLARTEIQRRVIPEWVAQHSVHSVVDVGAGDLNWIRHMEWPHAVEYTPLDLVPRAPSVKPFDLIKEVPPTADMGLCLWVLNHLPEDHARVAQDNLLAAGFKYLVYTWWPAMFDFLDLGSSDSVIIWPEKKVELRLLEC